MARPAPRGVPGRTGSLGLFNKKERAPHICTNAAHRSASASYAARAPATCDSGSLPLRGKGGLFCLRAFLFILRERSGRLPSILSCQLKKLSPRDAQQRVCAHAPGERQVWSGVPRTASWVQNPLSLPSLPF